MMRRCACGGGPYYKEQLILEIQYVCNPKIVHCSKLVRLKSTAMSCDSPEFHPYLNS